MIRKNCDTKGKAELQKAYAGRLELLEREYIPALQEAAEAEDSEQLRALYADYGWQDAIAEHKPSFSYVVPVFPGWRFSCGIIFFR